MLTFVLLISSYFAGALAKAQELTTADIVPNITIRYAGAMIPSCEDVKSHLAARDADVALIGQLSNRAKRLHRAPTMAESVQIKRVSDRAQADKQWLDQETATEVITWGLPVQTVKVSELEAAGLRKSYVSRLEQWNGLQGILPSDLPLEFDEAANTVTLSTLLRWTEICGQQDDFILTLGTADGRSFELHGSWGSLIVP